MRKTRGYSLLLLFVVLLQGLWAQSNDSLMFREGVQEYKQNQYSQAQKIFIRILKNYRQTKFLTATKLMLGKSYYKLGEYNSALIVCNNFLDIHAESDYLDDIHFLKGKIFFRQKAYTDAAEAWLWLIQNESDTRLKKLAGNYVYHTMDIYLDENEIQRLKSKYTDDTFSGLVEVLRAKKLMVSGRVERGKRELEEFIDKYPYHLYADIARELLKSEGVIGKAGNEILILKSSQEGYNEVSSAVADGMFYAAYVIKTRNPNLNVNLDTLTASKDALSMFQKVMPFLEQRRPTAVVGVLDNDKTASMTMLSRYEYFPFITPISSQNGLASLSPYAFQINPDAEMKGRFLADYAVNELGFETFALLAPADEYGETIANSFEEIIIDNDAELVEKQWYYSDTEDFSRQLKAIRQKGFYITFRDSVREADSTLSEEKIKEEFKNYMTETLFSDEGGREIDSTQVPSTGIDALFIAAYPEYVPFIAPQFAFHNIETTLLGNEGWNDPELLKQHRSYLDGLIYVTAGYYDPDSWNYKAFKSRFRQQMQKTPGMYHLLGYDVGKWMLSHYQKDISRRSFRDNLENSEEYEGVLENIKFGRKLRVNSQLNIVRFKLGQIMKIE